MVYGASMKRGGRHPGTCGYERGVYFGRRHGFWHFFAVDRPVITARTYDHPIKWRVAVNRITIFNVPGGWTLGRQLHLPESSAYSYLTEEGDWETVCGPIPAKFFVTHDALLAELRVQLKREPVLEPST